MFKLFETPQRMTSFFCLGGRGIEDTRLRTLLQRKNGILTLSLVWNIRLTQILYRTNLSSVFYGHSRLEIYNMEVSELLRILQQIYVHTSHNRARRRTGTFVRLLFQFDAKKRSTDKTMFWGPIKNCLALCSGRIFSM